MTDVAARVRATCEISFKALLNSKSVATAWNKTFGTTDAVEAETHFRDALDEYCHNAWSVAVSDLKQGGDPDARYVPIVYTVRAKVLETKLAAVLGGHPPTAVQGAIDCWDHVEAKVTKLVARSGGTLVSRWPLTRCFNRLDRSWVDGEPTLTTDETYQILTVPSFRDADGSGRLEQLIRDCGYSVQRHGIPVEHDLTSLKLIANYQVQDMGSFSIDLEPGQWGPFDVQLPTKADDLLDRLEIELALIGPSVTTPDELELSQCVLVTKKELRKALGCADRKETIINQLLKRHIRYRKADGQGWWIHRDDWDELKEQVT